MYTDAINEAFTRLIHKEGIYHQLGVRQQVITQLRWRNKHHNTVSLKTKIKYLQLAGIHLGHFQYTDKDMISFLRFWLKTSEQARQFGPEYVFEKWKTAAGNQ
jgi:hypothetical protein